MNFFFIALQAMEFSPDTILELIYHITRALINTETTLASGLDEHLKHNLLSQGL